MATLDIKPAVFDASFFDTEDLPLSFTLKYKQGQTVSIINLSGWTFEWVAYLGSTPVVLSATSLSPATGKLTLHCPAGALQGGKSYTHFLKATDTSGQTRLLLSGVFTVRSTSRSGGALTSFSVP